MPLLSNPFARRAGTVIFAATLATTIAACGGGSSAKTTATTSAPTSTTTANNTTSARRAAAVAYRNCLASHGVNLPARTPGTGGTGGGGGGFGGGGGGFGGGGGGGGGGGFGGFGGTTTLPPGVSQATYNAAQSACASLRPTFGGGGGANSAQFRTALVAYINCLKNHGVTGIGTVDPNNPQAAMANVVRNATYTAATAACRPLFPTRPTTTTTAA